MYKGTLDGLMQTWRNEGFFALYKGFWPNWLRLGPWNIIVSLRSPCEGARSIKATLEERENRGERLQPRSCQRRPQGGSIFHNKMFFPSKMLTNWIEFQCCAQ